MPWNNLFGDVSAIRQIGRQHPAPAGQFDELLATAKPIQGQKPQDKNKVYSVHEPKVACIAKGKGDKKYESVNKVSVATSSQGGGLLGALSLPDNPCDGHTITQQLMQTRWLLGTKAPEAPEAEVGMGYRGHNHAGPEIVHIDKRR